MQNAIYSNAYTEFKEVRQEEFNQREYRNVVRINFVGYGF